MSRARRQNGPLATHFSSIGLPVDTHDELVELVRKLADSAGEVHFASGFYLRWQDGSGAEVWLQIDRAGRLVSVTPAFDGAARLRVTLREARPRTELTPSAGSFHVESEPYGKDPASALSSPFVFDAPDFMSSAGRVSLPTAAHVQLTAFAHHLEVFESEDDYLQRDPAPSLGPETLVATNPAGEAGADDPDAAVALTGTVEAADERANDYTGSHFWWMLLRTQGGLVDVVADPQLMDRHVRVGQVVHGLGWLCGRVREFSEETGGVRRRVFLA